MPRGGDGPGRRLAVVLFATLAAVVALPATSLGHPERPTSFPDPNAGTVPKQPRGAPDLVVCKADSEERIRDDLKGKKRKRNLRLLDRCRFNHIQEAVDAAGNGTHIGLLPGVYREVPSRRVPEPNPDCAGERFYTQADGDAIGGVNDPTRGETANYRYQRRCPNAQNLIAIIGDSDGDGDCDDKCNIAIEGQAGRKDVLIRGAGYGTTDGAKLNLIRADRADGIYLANFTIKFSDFNNIYALETNGFRFRNIESKFSREYGFLSFASDNGLYERLEASGSGDSGIYPGSGPECETGVGLRDKYGIEIRRVNSHGNTIGYSGTAGNGIFAHDNRFHGNATGMTTDSFASGHPGMPQDCARWVDNRVYSNNVNLFNERRDEYCETDNRPVEERDPKVVCPTFQVPVGTGILIAGGNENLVTGNRIYNNWRDGIKLFFVPAAFRGEGEDGIDTSFENRFLSNKMGIGPGGAARPNGNDFWWDNQGYGNCWDGNRAAPGRQLTANFRLALNDCPGLPAGPPPSPGNPAKTASQAPCAAWDPQDEVLQDPPGCDWFKRPPKP